VFGGGKEESVVKRIAEIADRITIPCDDVPPLSTL